MTWSLRYTREAAKQIEKLDRSVKERIRHGLETLAQDPHRGKVLTGVLAGRWSYRVGDYRLLYKVYLGEQTVVILTVGHRREVYR